MKRIFKLLFVIAISLVFISCNSEKEKTKTPVVKTPTQEETKPTDVAIDYEEILNKALQTLNIPTEAEGEYELPTELQYGDYKIVLSWKGVNDNKLPASQDNDIELALKVEASLEGFKLDKSFTIRVLKNEVDYMAILDKAATLISNEDAYDSEAITFKEKDSIICDGYEIAVSYIYSKDILDKNGKIIFPNEEDVFVDVSCKLALNEYEKEYKLSGSIQLFSKKHMCEDYIETISIPEVINDDIELPTGNELVTVEWNSSNPRVLNNSGVVKYVSEDVNIKLTATVYCERDDDTYFADDLVYNVTVTRWDPTRRFELVIDSVTVPEETKYNLTLIKQLDYDVLCKWFSSDTNVLTDDGVVKRGAEDQEVILTLVLYCTDSEKTTAKTFSITVLATNLSDNEVETNEHNILDFAKDFNESNLNGLVLENGKVKLASGALTGTYESKVFHTLDFSRVVGSYSCITTANATCECSYSICVDGTWSKYFSYGVWGLGKTNGYSDSSDSVAKIDTDEIIVSNGKTANAIKYKFTLKRNAASTDTPVMSMVAMALTFSSYVPVIDTSSLPDSVDWDVPKLYQHDVPSIGGSICSPTTTTMLLLWKGIDINAKIVGTSYNYPHEYIARMATDSGHNIFGNWSYNMICAGSFGVDAYVATMSWDEARYQLANFGPIGASIKGNFGIYSTNGHLIVVRGYRITNGSTTVICNDPNVRGTYYEVSLDIFLNAWRNVSYVIL